MDYKKILQDIMNGDALLFLGAGYSYGAKNEYNENFLLGAELANKISNDEVDNLNIASSIFIEQYDNRLEGEKALVEELEKQFRCTEYMNYHEAIAKLPWTRIYTTNYDNIVENISLDLGIDRESITITTEMNARDTRNSIVHINGFIDDIEMYNFEESFRITAESYKKDGFLETPWKNQFIEDLKRCKICVFIGYSLEYDFALQQLIYSESKDKCLFIDIISDNKKLFREKDYNYKLYGSVEYNGVVGFADELMKFDGLILPNVDKFKLTSFDKLDSTSYKSVDVSPKTTLGFYIGGDFKRGYLTSPRQLVVKRDELCKNIINRIQDDKTSIFIVKSFLGNGKSVLLELIGYKLFSKYDTYIITSTSNLYDQLSIIEEENKENDNYYILVDDIGRYTEFFKIIKKRKIRKAKIIGTIRTPLFDNVVNNLVNNVGISHELIDDDDFDNLDFNELKELSDIIDHFNFWGKYSSLAQDERVEILRRNYKSRFKEVTYFLLESEDVKRKIDNEIHNINSSHEATVYLIAQAISSALGLKLEKYKLLSLMKINSTYLKRVFRNESYHEIIKFDQSDYVIRSSVFSDYILRYYKKEEVLEVLVTMFKNSKNIGASDKVYDFQKDLVSRSNLKLLIDRYNDGVESEEMYGYFYDKIQNHDNAKNNHFFWLHFGITMLNQGELELSKKYFDKAYALINANPNRSSSHVDAHYPRLLFTILEQTSQGRRFDFEMFTNAHNKLVNSGNKYSSLKYPLKLIDFYDKLHKKHISKMNDIPIEMKFNIMLDEIADMVLEYLIGSITRKYSIDDIVAQNIVQIMPLFNQKIKESKVSEIKRISKYK